MLSLQDCSLRDFHISDFAPCNGMPTKEKLQELKVPLSKEKVKEIQAVVSKYENLGKSRRWIRRYIKRKFNISEY